jgi:hypothetical protein
MVDNVGLLISSAELSVSATAVLGTWLRMLFVRRFSISWSISVSKGYWLEYRVMIPVMGKDYSLPCCEHTDYSLVYRDHHRLPPWIRSVDLFRHQRIDRDHTGYSLVYSDHTGYSLPYSDDTGYSLPCSDHTGYSLPHSDHTGFSIPCSDHIGYLLPYSDHTGFSLPCNDHTGYSLPYSDHTGFSLPYSDHTGFSFTYSDHTGFSLPYSDHTGYSLPYSDHTGFSHPYSDHTGISLQRPYRLCASLRRPYRLWGIPVRSSVYSGIYAWEHSDRILHLTSPSTPTCCAYVKKEWSFSPYVFMAY